MKDVTSTSFGLLIAFLLPGLSGLYALAFWSVDIRDTLNTFTTTDANGGLFLLVVFAGLTIGLFLTVLRWLLFERWICGKDRLTPEDFAGLGTESDLEAFRAAVDEHYRYHQFWGGMVIVLPIGYSGWLYGFWTSTSPIGIALSLAVLVGLELLIGLAAKAAYENYVRRSRRILGRQ